MKKQVIAVILLVIAAVSFADTNISAKNQEDIESQYAAGLALWLSHDYEEVFKCFKRLAEQGHAQAQYNLGLLYRNGEGTLLPTKSKLFTGLHELPNKDLQALNVILAYCMITAKEHSPTKRKLFTGLHKLPNKEMHKLNVILEYCIVTAKEHLPTKRKLFTGLHKLPNKEMRKLNVILEYCIEKVKEPLPTKRKLFTGIHKLLNKDLHKLNIILEYCIILA